MRQRLDLRVVRDEQRVAELGEHRPGLLESMRHRQHQAVKVACEDISLDFGQHMASRVRAGFVTIRPQPSVRDSGRIV